MTKDEALKLALDAFETSMYPQQKQLQAITAIKEALAQPEYQSTADKSKLEKVPAKGALLAQPEQKPEPMAFEKTVCPFCSSEWVTAEQHDRKMDRLDQEPVAWMYQNKSTHEVRFQKHMRSFVDHSKTSEVPLYSEPLANHELQCVCGAVWCGDEMVHLPNKAQPQRKPLMDEEIHRLDPLPHEMFDQQRIDFARAIEAAHGIKENK